MWQCVPPRCHFTCACCDCCAVVSATLLTAASRLLPRVPPLWEGLSQARPLFLCFSIALCSRHCSAWFAGYIYYSFFELMVICTCLPLCVSQSALERVWHPEEAWPPAGAPPSDRRRSTAVTAKIIDIRLASSYCTVACTALCCKTMLIRCPKLVVFLKRSCFLLSFFWYIDFC